MRKLKLKGVLLSLFLALPSSALALGMGDIKLKSALNQPFDAEIELLSVTPAEAETLKVALASRETFARLGLDRPAVLMFLRFSVEQKAQRHFIKVTSTEPIREPFLGFLLETRWSSGRLLREYTVLIDPPGLGDQESPIISAPVAGASRQAAAGSARQDSESEPSATLRYGPVKADETLWSIASRMRPDHSISVQQMMLALLKANPEAFYDNNVNHLKTGYVLRIDDPAMITAISHADAVLAISQQNRSWQDQAGRAAAAATDRPVTPSSEQSSRAVAAPVEPRLKLVAPEEIKDKADGAAGREERAGAAKEDLLLAQELAEAKTRESHQLAQRIDELEEQLAKMQRLIELKNTDLAALQQQLDQMSKASAEIPAKEAVPEAEEAPAAEAPETETAEANAATAAAEADADADASATATAETEPSSAAEIKPDAVEAPKPPAKRPQPAAKPVPAPAPVEQPGLLSEILSDPMMLGGLGVVVLALLSLFGLAVKRRRDASAGFSESILAASSSSAISSSSTLSEQSDESSLFSDLAASGMSNLQGSEADVDPLTEADVYMAYGRHQQAEELLKSALEAQPGRQDIKLKLLEVYYYSKERSAFEALAEELHAELEGKGPLWAKVLVMGHELCPDNPLFMAEQSLEAELPFVGDVDLGDALDIGIDMDALAEDLESAYEEEGGSPDFDLDLDLADLDAELEMAIGSGTAEQAASPAPAEEPANAVMDLGDLDFEALDFSEEEASASSDSAVQSLASEAEADDALLPDLDLSALDLGDEAAPAADQATADAGDAELDLGDLDFGDLDLGLDFDASENAEADDASLGLDDLDLGDLGLGDETGADAMDLGDLGLGDLDAVGTKLDLAKAYVEMGDREGAQAILQEVLQEGDDGQKSQAQELLGKLG